MKRLRLFSLIAILVLMATPLAVLAQDGTGKTKDFATEDGTLTVSYPEDWVVQENDPAAGLFGVTIANSDVVLQKTFADEASDFVAGEQAVVVFLLPVDFLTMVGMTYDPEASVGEMSQALVDAMFATEETAEGTATPEVPAVSPVEEIDLSEDLQAGFATITDPTLEGAVIVYEPVDQVIAITYVLAFPGEFNDNLAQIGKDVAASIQYTGTSDDLMNMIMGGVSGGSPTETATPGGSTGGLDGAALVDERCTSCHTGARIDEQIQEHTSLEEWTSIVDRMITYGTQLNAEERQAVLDYLSSQ